MYEKESKISKQLSISAWGSIDFNWVENDVICGFYGCNTGKNGPNYYGTTESFNQRVSKLDNFKDVSVLGQVSSSYPSRERRARRADSEIRSGIHSIPTYFVGSDKGSLSGESL